MDIAGKLAGASAGSLAHSFAAARGSISTVLLGLALGLLAAACGDGGGATYGDGGGDRPDTGSSDAPEEVPAPLPGLRINEVVANDEGLIVDELGEVGDWIELVNGGDTPVELGGFSLSDQGGSPVALPAESLPPGATALFWADDTPSQGPHHLPFKISSGGDRVVLREASGRIVDQLSTPALAENESMARLPDGSGAFTRCRYPSPAKLNGTRCGPAPPPGVPPDAEFAPYQWPPDADPPAPLAISEVALFPARFVEVVNTSNAPVALAGFELRLAPGGPGEPLPGPAAGSVLPWPRATLAPSEWMAVSVPTDAAALATIAANPEREGVLTLFRSSSGEAPAVIDRVDFMRWPDGAALLRNRSAAAAPASLGSGFRYCAGATPGAGPSDCQPTPSRAVGDRVRRIATPGDFAALAEGSAELESQSVKFVIDTAATSADDSVHFLSARRWALHYTFVRERIYREAPLDRCDPAQAALFLNGWIAFSQREYAQVQRRFLLGTLVRWGGSGLGTVEFAVGDVITGEQMRRAFFAVTSRLPDPRAWTVRPQAADQVERLRAVEGTLPIVDRNAPFRGQTFQPLAAGTGYGVLRFVAGAELADAALGPEVMVVTDEVPNDIPLVGGLITEAFQTPLSHVTILSKNRGTPNMALVNARTDPRVAPLLGKLVRLDVTGGGFTLREATRDEATTFWEKLYPKGEPVSPRLETSVRGLVDLATRSLDDLPAVGAKAAQMGELIQLARAGVACNTGLPLPATPFAIPLVHSLEHFQASGAAALFEARRSDPAFALDPAVRARGLADVQAAIMAHRVDPALVAALRSEIAARFGLAPVRLRSSSNTEDLPGFSGAGLYTSLSVQLDDKDRDVETGVKTVWASLWRPRAYDERELGRVAHAGTAMGILVHGAFPSERANGVAISRNVLDPIYGDAYYFNAQVGEASVTNPAPGVVSEQGVFELWRQPPVTYASRSSLIGGDVITMPELQELMCVLGAIHRHFRARIDPAHQNRWFAMDIEWKLLGPARQLLVKQARPYTFGRAEVPTDCREL